MVWPLRTELPDNTSDKASPSVSLAEEAASWKRPKRPAMRAGMAAPRLSSFPCLADAAPLVEDIVSGLGELDVAIASGRGFGGKAQESEPRYG